MAHVLIAGATGSGERLGDLVADPRFAARDRVGVQVPRKGRKVWTVAQLQTFLQRARSDRFFALWCSTLPQACAAAS